MMFDIQFAFQNVYNDLRQHKLYRKTKINGLSKNKTFANRSHKHVPK